MSRRKKRAFQLLKRLAAAALAFASAPALAQEAAPARPPAPSPTAQAAPLPDADPALWVVRDEDTTIYLFGTFHLLDERPWFNDEVRTAFDASNELVLEAIIPDDLASMGQLVARYARYPEGESLSQRLTPDQRAALNNILAGANLPAERFDRMKPWFVAMTLSAVGGRQIGIGAANGPEGVLTRAARARNMPVGELESVERQLQMLDSMPEAQQVAMLAQTLEAHDDVASELGPMLEAWSTGDVERLVAMLDAQSEEDPALHRLLFTERNRAWADWIRQRMARPGTVFLAVGAGHLAGSDSVQAALAEGGLRAERVPHVEAPCGSPCARPPLPL
ncbi:TraB/GumN family protein [Sphingosinicella sp. LHD-64]|uniref:TraB/GumN family protein n=1 Tax=Sphingosinicella sp. LHD-64 TaxID=3072139 RepID=UPI00280F5EB2|nr:TraB/GumN family protein [Sphingosinicella sp. LHD-64]MDQ8758137.1 TraB/GumN family protein [Sphingosinicella sp. LHD-64]